MARQTGAVKITGTYDELCFYKMDGEYYARMKSSLTGNRVKRDPVFKRTMANAAIFAEANKITSILYSELKKEEKGRAVRYELLRKVRKMLADGVSKEAIIHSLSKRKADAIATGEKILQDIFDQFSEEMQPAQVKISRELTFYLSSFSPGLCQSFVSVATTSSNSKRSLNCQSNSSRYRGTPILSS
jgi:uncharacterized protein YabN with tetrapyrrole methylase and pyrophosphatase domain